MCARMTHLKSELTCHVPEVSAAHHHSMQHTNICALVQVTSVSKSCNEARKFGASCIARNNFYTRREPANRRSITERTDRRVLLL